jgi:hypothetical protein
MDPNLLLTVNVPALSQAAGALPPEVIDVARLFDGQRVVAKVLDASHLSPRMTVAVVGRLWRLGLLEPLAPVPAEAPELRWVAAPMETPEAQVPAPERADDPLARALALAETLELPAVAAPPPARAAVTPAVSAAAVALEDTVVLVAPPAVPPSPAAAAASQDFDAADERFFDSYRPEPLPDDFVDLEDRPYTRRLAARRRSQGGWVSSFIGRLNSLLP